MNNKTIAPIVILLVVASFLVGSQWSKLAKNPAADASPSPQTPLQQVQTPSQPKVLGAADMDALVKGGVSLGPDTAKVTVVEFSDPACPWCAVAAVDALAKQRDPAWTAPVPKLEELAKQGKIRLVYRYFPGHGDIGSKAVQAMWCAEEQKQGVIWDYLNQVFIGQQKIFINQDKDKDLTAVLDVATGLGLDKEKINTCVQSGKYAQKIDTDTKAAWAATKLAGNDSFGTPTFFVNGTELVGAQPWSVFEPLINKELAK